MEARKANVGHEFSDVSAASESSYRYGTLAHLLFLINNGQKYHSLVRILCRFVSMTLNTPSNECDGPVRKAPKKCWSDPKIMLT